MYGCPHCYRIVKNKPAFEKHVNACKKKKYSCELCEFRSNELNLLDKHKEARHPKEYTQEENEVAKAEAMDTVEGEEDKTALKTEISVEESKVNSPVREDHLDTKTETDGSCELPDSKVVALNMEFTAEETKLSKLNNKVSMQRLTSETPLENIGITVSDLFSAASCFVGQQLG